MPHSVHQSSSPEPDGHEVQKTHILQPNQSSESHDNSSSSSTDDNIQSHQNLTDIFDDDEEDDELSNSDLLGRDGLSTDYTDAGIMRAFYQRLFPYRHLFQWLNHSAQPTNDFANREFAFTLPGDIYARYQAFPTADL